MSKKNKAFFSSIPLRMTFWYGLFLSLILMGLVFASMHVSSFLLDQERRSAISKIADKVAKGDLDMEQVDESYQVAEFDDENEIYDGSRPLTLRQDPAPRLGQTYLYKEGSQTYLLADRQIDEDDWLRVYTLMGQGTRANQLLTLVLFMLSPLVLLLVVGGGYLLMRRSFRPVAYMAETANQIIEEGDVKRRIPLTKGQNELNLLAQQFNRLLDKLEAMLEREKQLTNDLSHEIRTPLTTILAETEYGLRYADDLEESKESFQMVQSEGQRIKSLIEDILTYSRNEKLELSLSPLDLSELVRQKAKAYQVLAQEEKLELKLELADNLWIEGEASLLDRLVDNLFSNALKHATNWIKLSLREEKGKIILACQNDGPLIEGEQVQKIWDRFYQIDQDRNRTKQVGMGLGLSFVKQIADLHDAKVGLESSGQVPTRFFILFKKNMG